MALIVSPVGRSVGLVVDGLLLDDSACAIGFVGPPEGRLCSNLSVGSVRCPFECLAVSPLYVWSVNPFGSITSLHQCVSATLQSTLGDYRFIQLVLHLPDNSL